MHGQHNIKSFVKSRLFRGGARPIRIRHGSAKGIVLLLDRQHDLQREFGLFEIEVQSVYRQLIRGTSTVYDVGASDGDTALTFAKLASEGHVVALEPSSAACDLLERNLALNPELSDLVTVIRAYASIDDRRKVGDGEAPTVSLDTLVQDNRIPPPDFVKIDVDGGELDVLRGMSTILSRHKPSLLVETHSSALERGCSSLLAALDYDVRIVKNAWWRPLYPELRPIEHNRWLVAVPR
jgi:SAM-dependent methyltransferase